MTYVSTLQTNKDNYPVKKYKTCDTGLAALFDSLSHFYVQTRGLHAFQKPINMLKT